MISFIKDIDKISSRAEQTNELSAYVVNEQCQGPLLDYSHQETLNAHIIQ